jgi:hypothetical protein
MLHFTGIHLDDRGSIPGGAIDLSMLHNVLTGSWTHPLSHPVSAVGSFLRGKDRVV